MSKYSRNKSLNQLLGPYAGRWVALSANERQVMGVDNTAQGALHKAQEKGERCPHLIKAPDSSTAAYIY